MKTLIILICLATMVLSQPTFLDDMTVQASLYYDSKTKEYTIKAGLLDDQAPATASYEINLEKSGWDTLTVSSYQGEDGKYTDEVKSYAMGYIEGMLTFNRIGNHYENCNAYFNPGGKLPDNTREFLKQNREYVYQMYQDNHEDPYWIHAFSIYRQFEGIIDAYNYLAPEDKRLTIEDAMVMNSHDVSEIAYWKNKSARPDYSKMSVSQIREHVDSHNHCSALIKVAADFSDVWFGHDTWTSFGSMARIFKEYRFKSNDQSEMAKTIALSSYPGAVNSIDDFYITSKDLFITETTNGVFNNDLYDKLDPKTLLVWQRVMMANRLTDNGGDWTDLFAKNNSGTYNNQFQVLDLKLIDTDNQVIQENALWIIEQIPGLTVADDVTKILRFGYWPGYNTPFFPQIRFTAGYDEILKEKPELRDILDYETCARAKIFRREQGKVSDLESYKHLMRLNRYQTDPLSKGNPTYAIASRKDLDTSQLDCRGATDSKVASIKDIKGKKDKRINVIAGPTAEDQTPFSTVKPNCSVANPGKYPFAGLPSVYNFSWMTYTTTLFDDGE
jgi:hypothetical protein